MNGNMMQMLVDGMNSAGQKARAESEQLTLGELVMILESMPANSTVYGLGELMSYRGYYADLAFGPTTVGEPAAAVLSRCRAAMGEVFTGYKGGDFVMGRNTPLWVADYGCCGDKLMGIDENGNPVTAQDE